MAEINTEQFPQASAKALNDQQLQEYLTRSMGNFDGARKKAIEDDSHEAWEDLREKARQIKKHTIENLDYYLDLLHERVTRSGGFVHFATTDKQARGIIGDISKSRGLTKAIKSKSMVSEEIDLNKYLESIGVEPIETDLGEYIIQLVDETPFHIIAPALHKTRDQVGEIFAEKLNRPGLNTIEDMAGTAREIRVPGWNRYVVRRSYDSRPDGLVADFDLEHCCVARRSVGAEAPRTVPAGCPSPPYSQSSSPGWCFSIAKAFL